MTQEEKKNLLLRDLCARLPYNVYINDRGTPNKLINVCWDGIKFVVNCSPFGTGHGRVGTPLFDGDVCYVKPYLRPLSTMTEEEKLEFSLVPIYTFVHYNEIAKMDWLNEHHFDYRGLIEKGLAIEVTEDNNPYRG